MTAPGAFFMGPMWLLERRPADNALIVYGWLASFGHFVQGTQTYEECRPSVATLCEKTGFSESTVRRALDELMRVGAITRKLRRNPDGSSAPSVYTLHFREPTTTGDTPHPPTDDTPSPPRVTPNQEPNTQNQNTKKDQPLPPASPPGAQLALIDAPVVVGELVEQKTENGGTIVRAWCDWMATLDGPKLPGQIIARYGKAIKEALAEGFPPELVKRALVLMARDRVASRPSMFTTYLVRAQQGAELPPERMGRAEASRVRTGLGAMTPGDLADWLATPVGATT